MHESHCGKASSRQQPLDGLARGGKAGLLLQTLVLIWGVAYLSTSWADRITYDFSGEWYSVGWEEGAEPLFANGDEFTGSVDFYAQAAQVSLEDRVEEGQWVVYRPTGRMTLTIGSHTWSNAAPISTPCDVETRRGWLGIEILCRFDVPTESSWSFRLRFLTDGVPPSVDPYPEGPYAPDTFRLMAIASDVLFVKADKGGARGFATLDDVRRVEEPAMTMLLLMLGLGMRLARRPIRQLGQPFPARRYSSIDGSSRDPPWNIGSAIFATLMMTLADAYAETTVANPDAQ